MHEGEDIGLFSTKLTRADYNMLGQQQAASIAPPKRSEDDKPEPNVRTKAKSDDEDDDGDVDEMEEVVSQPTPQVVSAASTVVLNSPPSTSDVPGAVKGAKVRHSTLGEGEIISITSQGQARYVNCMLRGTKRMFPYPDIFIDGKLVIIEVPGLEEK